MADRRTRIVALAVAVLAVVVGACGGPVRDRERDTAAEARRDRIAAARAASPIGMVGEDELDVLDAFLQWRAEWDRAAADAFAALEARRAGRAGAAVAEALDELDDEAGDLAALDRRGVDATIARWLDEITAGYERQAAAVRDLAEAERAGGAVESTRREVVAAYDATVAVELRLLREVAEWLNEDAPASRARLHDIADAIERETEPAR